MNGNLFRGEFAEATEGLGRLYLTLADKRIAEYHSDLLLNRRNPSILNEIGAYIKAAGSQGMDTRPQRRCLEELERESLKF